MRKLMLLVTALALAVPTAGPAQAQETLLHVDDGDFFYDSKPDDGVCAGDNDDANGTATRHWHVGIPFAGADVEAAAGFGCLGGPKTFDVTVADEATVSGSIRYTWDTNVPGGCCNDVHLHVYDADGNIVFSTLEANGPQPIVPMVLQIRTHEFSFTLGAGTYTIVEDVFSGEHTAWLTKLDVVGA